MITLCEKIRPNLPWKDILSVANKDDLVEVLKYAGYRLTKRARKSDYIYNIDETIRTSPVCFLRGLSWDSLTILHELIKGKATFVSRPASDIHLDIQKSHLALTYTDETESADYLTVCPEVCEFLAPVIDSFMESREAKLHRLLDPCIFGLTNLYGYCPMPLLIDYLKEFSLFGTVEDIHIDEKTVLGLVESSMTFYDRIVVGQPGSLPRPYSDSKVDVLFVGSASSAMDKASLDKFFNLLIEHGIIYTNYKKFTFDEVVAAGRICPDFIFPEALKLKEFLGRSGLKPEKISAELHRYWYLKQKNSDSKEKLSFSLSSPALTSACDDFLSKVPLWVNYGYCESLSDQDIEENFKDVRCYLDSKRNELEELEKQEFPGFLPAVTMHPAIRPTEKNGICSRHLPHNTAEITIDMGDGRYFVCYALARKGIEDIGLYACWKRCFDVPLERFTTPLGIDPSENFLNKYKLFGRLLMNSENPDKYNNIRISLVSMNQEARQWFVCDTIPSIDWTEVVIAGADVHPEMLEHILEFYKINAQLCREIEKSDSKSFKGAFRQLYEKEN